MIKVCLRDGFVVFEFASAVEFLDAFPNDLNQDSLDLGSYVEMSDKDCDDLIFEKRHREHKRKRFQRLPQVGVKRNRSISELMNERD